MRLLEKLYRSPFGRIMSLVAHGLAMVQRPFMVYGYYDSASRRYLKYTRVSSSATLINRKKLVMGEHVWVWHYSVLDATEGLVIEDGAQIGAWVGIFTHGSESAIRLLGSNFVHVHNTKREGYTRGAVKIGAYTFVGAGSVILPGVTVGKGCLIGTGTLVTKNVPDYSIVVGSPGKVVGNTIDFDMKFFVDKDFSLSYYDREALQQIQGKLRDKAG